MKAIGLDIGTSKISLLVFDPAHQVYNVQDRENEYLASSERYEKIQDPQEILSKCLELVNTVLSVHPDIEAIGITGQMHGILYLDREGNAVSPLYTWEDRRGEEQYSDSETWAEHLSASSGTKLSTGFGSVTHFFNRSRNLIPPDACVFCTIADFVAMKLAGNRQPVLHATMAASIGLFRADWKDFDRDTIRKLDLGADFFPCVSADPLLGNTGNGTAVYAAIGDNQASFYGAVGQKEKTMLINMGTGGQLAICSSRPIRSGLLETRPFFHGQNLVVGATLCGGESYAILERFFRKASEMTAGEEIPDRSVYSAMETMLESTEIPDDLPVFIPDFNGTRKDQAVTAEIRGLTSRNFTPVHLTYALLYGMAAGMKRIYEEYLSLGGEPAETIVGAGNGLRKNAFLRRICSEVFGKEILLCSQQEEAAAGAAMYAADCSRNGGISC